MRLNHSVFTMIDQLDSINGIEGKESAWSSMLIHARKSRSLNSSEVCVIESVIKLYLETLDDEDKIQLFNETETGIASPADPNTAVLSQLELDLQMELLDEITNKLFDAAENSKDE